MSNGHKRLLNNMKKFMLAAVVLMTSTAAKAQNEIGQVSIGPVVGLNIASTTGYDAKSMTSFVVGVTTERSFVENLGLSIDILYSMQGARVKSSNDKLELNYLNFPILFNGYPCKGLALKTGIQPGFLLSAKAGNINLLDYCEVVDISIPFGISYESNNMVIDFRYNFGLKGIVDVDDAAKNSVFQLTLGYKFKFKPIN